MSPRGKRKSRSSGRVNYWELTLEPLQSLFFLLPLMLFYELALPIYGTDTLRRFSEDIYARRLLSAFFAIFGVTSYYLPGIIVVVVLVAWHIVRRDHFEFKPWVYLLMLVESLCLAIPLFVFLTLLARHLQLAAIAPGNAPWAASGGGTWVSSGAGGASGVASGGFSGGTSGGEPMSWQAQIVFSVGAGIYEELLFRIIVISLIHMIMVDVLSLSQRAGTAAAITISAVLFALYHFSDHNPFQLGQFIQLTAAGIYLAGVYVCRGFGIVAGTHAIYDVMVVLMQLSHRPR